MARAKSERWHARDFALLDPGDLRALGDGLELHADMPLVFLLFPLLSPLRGRVETTGSVFATQG